MTINAYNEKLNKETKKIRIAVGVVNVFSLATAAVTGKLTYNVTENKLAAAGAGIVAGAAVNIVGKEAIAHAYESESDKSAEMLSDFMQSLATDTHEMYTEHKARCDEYDRIIDEAIPR